MATGAGLTPSDPRPEPERQVRVSVVLPLYRPGPGAADALTRLVDTLGPHDQLLVVDDGTPAPQDAELADTVRTVAPSAELLVLPGNAGAAAARNHALDRATGRYVWFVDWDDDWDPTILDRLTDRAQTTGADVVTCRASVIDERHRLVRHIGPAHDVHLRGPQTARALLDGRLEGHLWNKLFRRDVLPADVFPLVPTLSDLLGTAPVLAAADRIEHLGQVLYEHRIRPGSLTASGDRDLTVLLEAGAAVPAAVTAYLRVGDDAERLATLFRHRSAYLTAVTALRLPQEGAQQEQWLRRSRQLLTLAEAARLLPTAPTTAARSMSLLLLGGAFGPVYRGVTRWRGRVRPRTHRHPWRTSAQSRPPEA
nr:glycosyltransferase [Ornithinimicrobium cryptoxanthini]